MKQKSRLQQYQKILSRGSELLQISEELYNSYENPQTPQMVGCYVLAPAVISFCAWLIAEAKNQQISRLYFLARDGYQFCQATERLCKQWGIDMECRYLMCSRYSLRIPLFHRMGEESLEYICLGGLNVTFEKVMHRAGIYEEAVIRKIAGETGYEGRLQEELSYQQVQSLRPVLKNCKSFMKIMTDISQKSYDTAHEYFVKEGLFDSVNYGLVDSGWTGSMQKVLQKFLWESGDKRRLQGFYWGMYELPTDAKVDEYHTFYFGVEGQFKRKVFFNNCLFEAIFSAPHGMTLEYRNEHDNIRVICDEKHNDNRDYIEQQNQLIQQYVRLAAETVGRWDKKDIEHMIRILQQLLTEFMAYPSKEEAGWYGNYYFTDDVREEDSVTLADKLDGKALREYHVLRKFLTMYGICKDDSPKSAWYEASAVMYGQNIRWHQWQQRGYKYLIYLRKELKRRIKK